MTEISAGDKGRNTVWKADGGSQVSSRLSASVTEVAALQIEIEFFFFSSPPEKKWIIGMFLAAFMSRDLLHLRGTEAIAFWSVSRDERRQSSLSIPTLVLFLFYMSFPAGFHFSSVVETEAGYVFLKSAWLEKWACLLSAGNNTEFELCFPFRFKFPPRALHSWRL